MSRMNSSAAQDAALPRMSEDERAELAMAASRAERAARPRAMLVLASVAVVVAGVAFVISLGQVAAAEVSLRFQRNLADSMAEELSMLRQLREAAATEQAAVSDEVPQIRSRLGAAAEAAGIKNGAQLLPDRDFLEPKRPGMNSVQRKFKYTVQDQNLGSLLDWMRRATEQVDGLEVYQVDVIPKPQDWQLVVTFARWEKKAS